MEIKFSIETTPIGKGRPRFARISNFVKTYTPQKTKDYEEIIFWAWKAQSNKSFPEKTPLKMEILAEFEIPKTQIKKKTPFNEAHMKKPDCDNLAKTIMDALNGNAYKDDAQIVELCIKKKYSAKDCVTVKISTAEEYYV